MVADSSGLLSKLRGLTLKGDSVTTHHPHHPTCSDSGINIKSNLEWGCELARDYCLKCSNSTNWRIFNNSPTVTYTTSLSCYNGEWTIEGAQYGTDDGGQGDGKASLWKADVTIGQSVTVHYPNCWLSLWSRCKVYEYWISRGFSGRRRRPYAAPWVDTTTA